MNVGQTIFSQLMDFLPTHEFNRCVRRYRGNHRVRLFSCRDQFLCMAFAQLPYRESLRDIETCLRSVRHKLYHAHFRATVARSTLANDVGRVAGVLLAGALAVVARSIGVLEHRRVVVRSLSDQHFGIVVALRARQGDQWADIAATKVSEEPYGFPQESIKRWTRYKLIHFYGRDGDEWELIDLKVDPLETKNFYDAPEYAKVRAELHAELERRREQYKVPHDAGTQPKKSATLQVIKDPKVVVNSAKPALRNDLDPSNKPFTVAADVTPKSADGVVISQGGGAYGWSLYLDKGRPTFVIRENSAAKQVKAPTAIKMNESTHIAAVLTAKLTLQICIDGKRVAEAPGHAIAQKPGHEYSFGQDTMDPVGDYTGPAAFDGMIESPRVIWGALDEEAIAGLADE